MRREGRGRQGWIWACLLALPIALSGCTNQTSTRAADGNATAASGGDARAAGVADAQEQALALARFDEIYTRYSDNPGDARQRKHFRDAFARIRAEYVEDISDDALISAAIAGIEEQEPAPAPGSVPARELVERALDGMTAKLDPHSTYLNSDELRDTEISLTGRFGGLGIRVAREDGMIRIISPIEGTPADAAGLQAGDLVTHVDGQPIADLSLMQAVNAMRGAPGTAIDLTIKRGEAAPFNVAITRAIINIRPARWQTFGTVGYLRIVNFNVTSARAVENAVREIRAELGDRMTGLIVDLRRNPGGAFGQSLRIADAFLDDGVIVSVRGRGGETLREHRASAGDLVAGLPIVVLIDGGSASASEIVASALQDHGRAVIMGSRSFGKGSVQTLLRLPVEGAVKLTTALYYAPSGRSIQARGVIPHVRLVGAEDTVEEEADDELPQREADLPGAFPSSGADWSGVRSRVDESLCRPLGDPEDHALGCAVEVLNAGSVDAFLSKMAPAVSGSG